MSFSYIASFVTCKFLDLAIYEKQIPRAVLEFLSCSVSRIQQRGLWTLVD